MRRARAHCKRRLFRGWVFATVGLALCVPGVGGQDPPTIGSARQVALDDVVSIAVAELSGLAWDAGTNRLYAVSDRGLLVTFSAEPAGPDIRRLTPVSAVQIAGIPRKGKGPVDAEGMAVHRDLSQGLQFLVASEREQRIWRIDASGRILGEQALPGTLSQHPVLQPVRNKGLESVAITPEGELVVALEETAEPGVHVAFGSTRQWRWPSVNGGKTRVKDIAFADDGSLVWLEREDSKAEGTRVHVRTLKPAECPVGSHCPVKELGVLPHFGGSGNFEGLTQLGPHVWLAVSDEGGKPERRAAFVLFRTL